MSSLARRASGGRLWRAASLALLCIAGPPPPDGARAETIDAAQAAPSPRSFEALPRPEAETFAPLQETRARPVAPEAARLLDRALARRQAGLAALAAGDAASAVAALEESFLGFEALANADRADAIRARDAAAALVELSAARLAAGALDVAIEGFATALTRFELIEVDAPSEPDAARDTLLARDRLAAALLAIGDRASARTAVEQGLDQRRELAAAAPEDAALRLGLIVALVRSVETAPEQAAARYREALALALDAQAQGRLAAEDAWMIDELQARLARLQ